MAFPSCKIPFTSNMKSVVVFVILYFINIYDERDAQRFYQGVKTDTVLCSEKD